MTPHIRKLPPLRLTPQEFNKLLEYSASLPTGMTIGKRWKRLDGAHDHDFVKRGGTPAWMIGEYAAHEDPKKVRILWYRPVITIRAAVAP